VKQKGRSTSSRATKIYLFKIELVTFLFLPENDCVYYFFLHQINNLESIRSAPRIVGKDVYFPYPNDATAHVTYDTRENEKILVIGGKSTFLSL
jgi:hypothetical protein